MEHVARNLKSPLGNIYLEASERGITCCKLTSGPKKITQLHVNARAKKHLEKACKSLESYFRGNLKALDDITVEAEGTEFQKKVWSALRSVKAGSTKTYGEIAKKLRNANASRAVGTACGANPVGLIVPCHRIIASNGTLGGYNGGLNKKVRLLKHEGSL